MRARLWAIIGVEAAVIAAGLNVLLILLTTPNPPPSTIGPPESDPVVVTQQQVLPAAPVARIGDITGRVLWPDGVPFTGGFVRLLAPGGSGASSRLSAGFFRLEGVEGINFNSR